MTELRKSSTWFFILILLVVLAAAYLFFKNVLHKDVEAIKAIPPGTAMFIEIENPAGFSAKMFDENAIWQALQNIPEINRIHAFLKQADSVLSSANHPSAFKHHKWILSFHIQGDSLPALIVLEGGNKSAGFIKEVAETKASGLVFISEHNDEKGKILQYRLKPEGKDFYLSSRNGLSLISTSKELITLAIDQIINGVPVSDDKYFTKVHKTIGKNVDAHVYLNIRRAGDLLAIAGNKFEENDRKLLNNLAEWTELDFFLKKNELLLSGYTVANDSLSRFMNAFRNQKPVRTEIIRLLPFNTHILFSFGFSDFNEFYRSYEEYLKGSGEYESYYNKLVCINNKYSLNAEKHFLSWIGKEMGLASMASKADEFGEKSFLVLEAKDAVKANQLLTEVMHNVPGSGIAGTYKGYLIKKINLPGIYELLFGNLFAFLDNPYYTIINDYVVFGNGSEEIEEFIGTYTAGKTLDGNANFKDFSDNISESSNILLYFSTRNSLKLLEKLSNEKISEIIGANRNVLNNFQAFTLQFSAQKSMFYTNAYLRYNADYVEESRAIWKTGLDAPVLGKPYLVRDHTDKTYNIIAFDNENQLYLIDNKGNTLWKMPYAGKLLSEVYAVDYYKNRKIQYLFNTDEYLYLIDLLGRKVANYPIKLGANPSNGIAVFDYINNKNYRILFAGENNKIYNYNIKGNAVRGWNEPKAGAEVRNTIQHLVAANKDYIIIPQTNGDVLITDRRGSRRIKIRDDFKNSLNSSFYVNETNSKGILLTTDINGHLIYIKASGRTDKTVFGDFSEDHYFLYHDLDKNGAEDFIFLDKNELIVFDRFKETMFTHSFKENISCKPQIIPVSYRENLLGVVSSADDKIFLFDDKGNIVYNAGLAGSTPFAIGSLNNDKDLNLLIGSGSTLYNYLLK